MATAGCLLSSCASETPDQTKNSKSAEMLFDVSAQTRATETIPFNNFAVYGDIKLADSNEEPEVVFNNTEVVKTDNGWSYQDIRYWYDNHEHSFVAIYPLSVLASETNPTYSGSKLSFNYSLPVTNENYVDVKNMKDIMAATHRRFYSKSDANNDANSVITFRFAHLLSLINFSLELYDPTQGNNEYFIRKLEISGFDTSATIDIKPASRQSNKQTDDREIAINTNRTGRGQLAIEFEEPIKISGNGKEVGVFNANDALIMLPQTFAANAQVPIRLTYSVNNGEETTEVSAFLSGFTWESGKSYNYKIKLELEEPKEMNMVISEATIDPWNLVEGPDIVDAR